MTLNLSGQHVVITGGSEGIGLALAEEFVKAGSNVTIISRASTKLAAAELILNEAALKHKSNSFIFTQPADVTNLFQVQEAVKAAVDEIGPVDILICNAGSSTPGYFHEQGIEVFEQMMRLNYLGVVHTVKAVYEDMIKRNTGHICFISSTMALMGFTGYSAYAASKYAVRGFAECLRNEVQGSGVKVSIAFPPDTITPGFDVENRVKPIETSEISEGSKPFPAEQVARYIVKGLESGNSFHLPNPDFGLRIHAAATKGIVPRNIFLLLPEMLIGLIAPIIHFFYASFMDKIATKHASRRFSKFWNPS
ncbi:hypothetical protein CEUSTIGMA_g6852.t1 [Chlamydomonas eustigma]|uniref:3-dehydrosphinganine reductase n=1 Tax=Chlamydomonas eustigma TaxID=1157962 RepID=A0A250X8J8_9CHLO|nr:hypothetical protein CEUSTIGMA_g6852.t1 [Chlamydomonas eustigma]|eukprot:GAX79411.1 hypothetical protein CEUSTIGMA_g6852.t1 [Chlamydomonas eustigma]